MPRPMWTGTISFGLVAVPVKLFAATENRKVRFHQLERGTGERIRHQRVAESSGREVPYEDIVKGYEVRPGEHVIVEPEELDAVDPGPRRTIEVEDFVDIDAIDPVHFNRSYYAAPGDQAAARAYRLLTRAMADTGRAAIGRFVLRSKQHLAALHPSRRMLVLETLFFADEVRDPAQLEEMGWLEEGPAPSERELSAATELIDSLTRDWDPARYRDTYREQVLELVQRKVEGEEVVTEEEEEPAPVVDLMEALERSLQQTGGRSRRRPGGSGRPGGKRGGPRRRTGGTGTDYGSMTKDQLYEEAQRHGIAGRSKMSRDQLVSAVRKAS